MFSVYWGGCTLDNDVILSAAHLIPFKAKAWLDLNERKAKGEQIDSRNIRKHKNDIIRLSALLTPDFKLFLPDKISDDMRRFLATIDTSTEYLRTAAAYGLADAILN